MQITFRFEVPENAPADFAAAITPQVLSVVNRNLPGKKAVVMEASEGISELEVAATPVTQATCDSQFLVRTNNGGYWVVNELMIRGQVHAKSVAGLRRTLPFVDGMHADDLRKLPLRDDVSPPLLSGIPQGVVDA